MSDENEIALDGTEQSEVVVIDLVDVVRNAIYQRGLDPAGMEIVDARISDDQELAVHVRASSHNDGGQADE